MGKVILAAVKGEADGDEHVSVHWISEFPGVKEAFKAIQDAWHSYTFRGASAAEASKFQSGSLTKAEVKEILSRPVLVFETRPHLIYQDPKLEVEKQAKLKKVWIADRRHEATADPKLKVCRSHREAVEAVHAFFLGYGFELRGGVPYDPGHASYDGDPDGFKPFDDVKVDDGKVASFMHAGGEGPTACIRSEES